MAACSGVSISSAPVNSPPAAEPEPLSLIPGPLGDAVEMGAGHPDVVVVSALPLRDDVVQRERGCVAGARRWSSGVTAVPHRAMGASASQGGLSGKKPLVVEAVLYGLAASSALVVGAFLGTRWDPPRRVTGVLLAFASGALISALAFELFEEAFELGGAWRSGAGLLAGAAAFVLVDSLLDKHVAGDPGAEQREVAADAARGGVGWALLAAVTLDGVPENLALGVSLVEGASLTLLVAIFFSNLPESLVGAVEMRHEERSTRQVMTVWLLCAALLTIAVVVGRAVAGGLGDSVLAVALGFAGGAVLASLADTLMPEAFEHGRPLNAFATAGGFFLSFVLAA